MASLLAAGTAQVGSDLRALSSSQANCQGDQSDGVSSTDGTITSASLEYLGEYRGDYTANGVFGRVGFSF